MISFYLQIKLVHIGLVLASGSLFALRGLMVQLGQQWPMWRSVRRLSIGIDTLLLTSGVMLLWVLRLNPITTGWIATKLTLLVVYIVLGVMALHRARSRRTRLLAWLAALAVFGFIYSVARAHHPLGILLPLLG